MQSRASRNSLVQHVKLAAHRRPMIMSRDGVCRSDIDFVRTEATVYYSILFTGIIQKLSQVSFE